MALFGKGGRRRKTLLTAVVTAGTVGAMYSLTMLPAGAVAPGGCTYNPATQTVTIQQEATDFTTLGVVDMSGGGGAPNEIQITADTGTGGAQDCGSATTTNTTSVVMLGSGLNATDEMFTVDNSDTGGSFGAIAFSIDMGNNAVGAVLPALNGDVFAWIGTAGADDVTVTNTTFEANGGTGTLVGTEFQQYYTLAGGDAFDGSGVTSIPLIVESGPGSDDIISGGGNDNCLTWPVILGTCSGYYWTGPGDAGTAANMIHTGSSRADGQDEYYGDAGFDGLDATTRTAANWLSNNGAYASGEGTCPGATPGCEGDLIWTDIDELFAGSGNDRLEAAVAGTWLNGGPGDDTLDANGLADVVIDHTSLFSSPAPDLTITESAGTITGWGNDVLVDDPGDLSFVGGGSNDTFVIDDATSFQAFCGAGGTDLVDASATTTGVGLDLTTAAFDGSLLCGAPVPGSGDTTENVIGGSGDDAIVGNSLANTMSGGDGNDLVFGAPAGLLNDGRDWLEGGNGNDSFFGGTGADTVSFKNCECADGGITADISLGFAEGEGSDTILDYIEIVEGSKKGDKIKTGPTGLGSSINTWIRGFGGGDQLTGSDGNDQMAGGGGNDRIRMGAGDDDGLGGGGNDKFWGGGGTDSADGGKGKNTCKGVEIRKHCKKAKSGSKVGNGVAAKLARLN